MQVRLPNGASLTAVADLSKGIPTDCSLAVNLLLQLGPFLASIECLLKVLALLKPLIDVVKGLQSLPDPSKVMQAVPDFLDAAVKLMPCFEQLLPSLNVFNFVRDLLLMIIKIINCMVGSLQTILGIMQGIELRLEAANASGNTALAAVLECARENAAVQAQHAQSSLGPVQDLMPLIMTFLELAGIKFELPALGSPDDSAALAKTIQQLKDTTTTLQSAIESLPG
jgi:hypothetical protein